MPSATIGLPPHCAQGLAGSKGARHTVEMQWRQRLGAALAPVVDFVFPPRCPLCGEGTADQGGVCAICWQRLDIPGEPACESCQRPLPGNVAQHGVICAPCLAEPPRHDGILAATLYNEASRQLVLSFKHGGRIGLARPLARMMAARIGGRLGTPGSDWLVVPVPLHRFRLWRRGYNQAALLADEIARKVGARQLVDGLLRVRNSAPLRGLGRKARARELRGAIRVNPARESAIKGARIILVDDVLTSGATSSACVSALKRAGADRIVIACFARVLDEARDPRKT